MMLDSADPRRVVAPDGTGAVDLDDDMEPVIAEHQHLRRAGIAAISGKGVLIRQAAGSGRIAAMQPQRAINNGQRRNITPATPGKGEGLIEEGANAGDNLATADRVIAGTTGIAIGRNGIGAIKGVVETAKAGIGGIQRITGVGDRHDKLRPGDAGDLWVNARGIDAEIRALLDQIADFGQKRGVGIGIDAWTGIVAVPLVDLCLHAVALGQQLAVARRQTMNGRVKSRPEVSRCDIYAVKQLVIDEIGKLRSDRQVTAGDVVGHHSLQGVDSPGGRAVKHNCCKSYCQGSCDIPPFSYA